MRKSRISRISLSFTQRDRIKYQEICQQSTRRLRIIRLRNFDCQGSIIMRTDRRQRETILITKIIRAFA